MTNIAVKSANFNLPKTQNFHRQMKNIRDVVHVSLIYGSNRPENPGSFGSYGRIQPNIDVINGKKINGISLGKKSDDIVLKKGQVTKNYDDDYVQPYMSGKFVEGQFVFRQTFIIRSYEIGPDETATMETLMNLLQVGYLPN